MNKKITVEIEVWRIIGIVVFMFIGLVHTFNWLIKVLP